MSEPESPLKRSIGLSGILTFVVAITAAIAVGAALFDGQYALAAVAAVFFVGATLIGIRARRHR
jgi:hypothetical protein